MINLFQFAANDKSCSYLISIFGSMNGVICNPATTSTGSTLSAMFQTFNSVVLAVAVIVVVYTTVVGVMMTAHEGEFMGKKWNNIWIPIRMVLGIAALVPLGGGGYSLIQYVLMWVVVQGIGAADTLWTTAINAVVQTGSIFAKPTIPTVGVQTTMGQLYASLVCDATAKIKASDPTGTKKGGYYCSSNSSTGMCSSNSSFTPTCNKKTCTVAFGPNGNCGKLSWCDSSAGSNACSGNNANSLKCAACTAQNGEVMNIVNALATVAAQFASMDYNYRDFVANSWQVSNNPNWDFIYDYCSANNYAQQNCCVPNVSSSLPALLGGGPTGTCPPCGSIGATSDTCKGSTGGTGDSNTSSLPPVNDGQDGNTPQSLSDEAVENLVSPELTTWISSQSAVTQIAGSNSDFITGMTADYANKIGDAANAWITAQNNNTNSTVKSIILGTVDDGWILAGTMYYTLAGMNNNNMSAANVTFTVDGTNPAQNSMNNYRNNYTAAKNLVNLVTNASADPGGVASVKAASPVAGPVASTLNSVNQGFSANISGSTQTNPLSQLQSAGMGMLISVEILFTAILVTTIILGITGNIDVWALGTGALNPAGPMAALMYLILVPMFFALFGILITMGGLLAVYVPLIPYIVFTVGAIGWLLAVIETMVAGPLVAIGIISPSGQHELLGKAEPALMLLFNVFLRPSLMIFGLMAAIYLASVVVTMINAAFWSVASAIGGLGDPLTSILFVAAYVMIIVSALNKCFAAIHIIPQQVMSWIGGHGQPGGSAGEAGEVLSEAKGGVSTTGSKAAGALEGGGGAAGKGAVIGAKRADAIRKEQEASALGASDADKNKGG